MKTLTPTQFERGYRAFQRHEGRDSTYRTATFLVEHFWESPREMADSLGVLLLTWNQALYRYGIFDFDRLEECISSNLPLLREFRKSNILGYSTDDDRNIKHLFDEFSTALKIRAGTKKGTRSPVAVAKALHLVAPDFFPLWDHKIAKAYGYAYSYNPEEKYLSFLRETREIVARLQSSVNPESLKKKTFLKLIDEYNYAKYTKGWI